LRGVQNFVRDKTYRKANMDEVNLTKVEPGREVIVIQLTGGSQFQEKAESLGLRTGIRIKKLSAQVMRGPVTIKIGNTKGALGYGMAKKVLVSRTEK